MGHVRESLARKVLTSALRSPNMAELRLAHDTGSSIGRSAPITLVSFSPEMLRRRGRAHHEGGRWGCRGMWTLAYGHHEDRWPIYCYEPMREAAMVAFAQSWRRE